MKKLINIRLTKLKSVNILFVSLLFIFGACENGKHQNQSESISGKMENGNIIVKYNGLMYSKVISKKEKTPLMDDFQGSEYIKIDSVAIKKFRVTKHSSARIKDRLGSGTKLILVGNSVNKKYPIQKRLVVKAYDKFPDMIITQVSYKNMGNDDLKIDKWVNNSYQIQAQPPVKSSKIAFWSYQSGTYPSRNDWIRPIKNGYHQKNYMGMNASDYGGGTPVTDIWRRDVGLAVGDISMVPQLISLPVSAPNIKKGVHLGIEYNFSKVSQKKIPHIIKPGQSLTTLKTFAEVHTGDFFQALREYSDLMRARGMSFPKWPKGAYQPVWCAWGYGREMNLQQVLNTIPTAKKLGFEWVVLDDGWQKAEGSWMPNSKFQNISMKQFVDEIHDAGMKAKLWWSPMSADSGSHIFKNHPDWFIINKKGNRQQITWWNSYYLDPADPNVVAHAKKMVNKFMNQWGFDGLKIDGQFLNQVPPDYSSSGSLKYPEESVEQLPDYLRAIYKAAEKACNNKAVVEICPCGTAASYYIMTAMNQPVASDPKDSWQVRHRGKVYKALLGPRVPYYGDHVELSNGSDDFASTIGIGGVPGSKFTVKEEAPKGSYGYKYRLTPSKKRLWKKWLSIYNSNMLSKGKYLGALYDIGFEKPEGHAILKDGKMYYAFYARNHAKKWHGKIHLKGLKRNKKYKIIDYVNGKKYGVVSGPVAAIDVNFKKHLLLKAIPVSSE